MSPQHSHRDSISFLRGFGWLFVLVGVLFIVHQIFLLFDPNAIMTINGVKRTDIGAKIIGVFFSAIPLGFGLFLVFAPESTLRERRRARRPLGPILRFRRWQKRLYRR
jgi:hypothetical protein